MIGLPGLSENWKVAVDRDADYRRKFPRTRKVLQSHHGVDDAAQLGDEIFGKNFQNFVIDVVWAGTFPGKRDFVGRGGRRFVRDEMKAAA